MMSFRIKNPGATYQRFIIEVFKGQIRRILEVYIDDMVVKSQIAEQHIEDLNEFFRH